MASSRLERIGTIYSRVEGLLRSKAMKVEDRPLWWDVYRAFPPKQEPTFARPQPVEQIRNIFYSEDIVRSKFHKSGQPLGTVRLTDDKNKSNCQKFLALYKNVENTAENIDDKEELFNETVDMLQEYFALKSEWKEHNANENVVQSTKNKFNKESEPLDKDPKISEKVIKDIFN